MLLKSIFWPPISDYANHRYLVHASEVDGLFSRGGVQDQVVQHTALALKHGKKIGEC